MTYDSGKIKELMELNHYKQVVQSSSLFSDIPPELYPDALKFMKAQLKRYRKDEFILHTGQPFRYGILLLEGSIEGSFITENFHKINMNNFEKGMLIGESLACAREECSPIQLRAMTDITVLFLDFSVIYDTDHVKHSYQLRLSLNLVKLLSRQNVFLSNRIRILGQRTIRDRIIMYMDTLQKDSSGQISLPFTITAFAEYLGVNRSALSREMSNMEKEGVIERCGKCCRIVR